MKKNVQTIYAVILIAYTLWICMGWLFGFHWILLANLVKSNKKERYFSIFMFFLYIASAGLLSLGAWCRNSGRYVKCPKGEEMSRSCLWNTQNVDYIIIYILHYIGLAFLFSAWLLDALQLPSWIFQIYRMNDMENRDNENKKKAEVNYLAMKLLKSDTRFVASWSYIKMLLYCVLNITIVWTLIVPWSTNPEINTGTVGLGGLFWILVAVIMLTASVVHYFYIYSDLKNANIHHDEDVNANQDTA